MVVPGSMPNIIFSVFKKNVTLWLVTLPMLSYKSKQYLVATLKVSVVITSFVFIYFRVASNSYLTFGELQITVSQSFLLKTPFILILFALTFLNWSFEILKWQTLARCVAKVSLKQSAIQVLMAQSISLFTPLKIGEYGAKTLFFTKKQIKKVVFLNFLGNMSQLAATIFFGFFGLTIYFSQYFKDFTIFYLTVLIFAAILIVLGNWLWHKINFSIGNFTFHTIRNFSASISKIKKQKVLGFAFFRYAVFSVQFCFILNCLIPISFIDVLPLVFMMYLISSAIPVLQFFDVLIKGSVAVLVFSGFNELILLSTTTLMWLLNAVLPSIIGSYFVLNFNTNPLLKTKKI